MVTDTLVIRIVEGQLRSVIRSFGCDQKGRRLGRETGVKQVSFQVFPEACDRWTISYLEGESFPKNRGIVTDRIGKCLFHSEVKVVDVKELMFRTAASCVSVRVQ